MSKKTLAIIPARMNSKGIKNKNVKILNGKPLIKWTINFVKELDFVNKILVSSDSPRVKKISEDSNVDFIQRPAKLSSDESRIEDTILYILKLSEQYKKYDYILLFEPTSPLRTKKTVENCFEILKKNKNYSVFTVCESNKYYGKLNNNNFFALSSDQKRRRQERENIYYECGVVYCLNSKNFIKKKKIIDKKSFAYVIDETEAIDINTDFDFTIVKSMIRDIK